MSNYGAGPTVVPSLGWRQYIAPLSHERVFLDFKFRREKIASDNRESVKANYCARMIIVAPREIPDREEW